ncbi:diguanylate cyclase [Vibrio sp. Isolate24]|uniref:GGDEF domain-containing protein n=1 Tax=Vibrio sp. Isolate24 TaxID=2908534 RepID=UPI001EFE9293|nr:diguanylate cyclase [Vibrio sp. Isolate24]MCG9677048.1 diguanylate cyclase [Vibrio sp. Isolate24]
MILHYSKSPRSNGNIELKCLAIMLIAVFAINTPLSFIKDAQKQDISFQLKAIDETLKLRKQQVSNYLALRKTQLAQNYFEHPEPFNDVIRHLLTNQDLIDKIEIVTKNPEHSYRYKNLIDSYTPFYASSLNADLLQILYQPDLGLLTEFAPIYQGSKHIGYLVVDINMSEFNSTSRKDILLADESGFIYSSSHPSIERYQYLSDSYSTVWRDLSRTQRSEGILEQDELYFIYRNIGFFGNKPYYLMKVIGKDEFIPKYLYLIMILLGVSIGASYYLYKLRQERRELSKITYTDQLSGLYNRHYLQKVERQNLANGNYYLGIFDIDHFKSVNDKYGHDVGDQVIKRVASIIKSRIRVSDYAFRIGGEEFVILIRTASMQDAQQAMNRIRMDVSQFTQAPKVTISGGLYPYSGTLSQSLKRADELLYQAKQNGRNAVYANT